MKILKKALIGIAIFIVVILAAAIALPIIFKDDIKAAIDKAIAKNVNADVVFDVNNFSLTVFKNFPNITLRLRNLVFSTELPLRENIYLWFTDWI